ncbi:Verru_Chthon cassette protein A [Verrucomicrobium sp. BvORR106]|uniref:Verru_Chthon cassette protein A n=1 Tax=Verrucomicrobium sp. BvORR106 TaxID=1403819 RepID=UPI00056FA594|nr:Verru_Chthon cassette protein A [Verrucomicrobium sp. BvORR106]
MKTPFSHLDLKRPHPPRGIALIMVLVAVAVVAMLVLAFMAEVRTEHRSASAYSNITEARTLSELPVNMAIGQIRRATEQNGLEKTWASQPGMIRVFGTESDVQNASVRAKTVALYKLYSDDAMVVTQPNATGSANGMALNVVKSAINTDVSDLSTWQNVPGLYADMNEPAAVMAAGADRVQTVFPISDPRAIFARNGGLPVDGYKVNGTAVPGTVVPTSVDDVGTRLPMPVKWMYVLADGQVLVPNGGNKDDGLTFGANGTAVPTKLNPIVGRVAFWTDDESTKINVNTATEGSAWDVPRAFNGSTAKFARFQPAQNEYSRYPGHPAQTALSPVFQAFGQQLVVSPLLSDTQLATVLQRYHQISPRVPWGGSYGGTQMPTVALVPDKDDRLYTTLDELVFNRNRGMQDPALTQQDIATARFFLTPHSRAPELNLFNQPRVMLWPISAEPTERNAKDKLLAFVGTGGGKPWYFTRLKNFKSVDDAGTGQKIRGDLDLDSSSVSGALARNRQLYENHLVPLTGGTNSGGQARDIPGFGGNFAAKYSVPRRNQILTEMVDFMRWSVNSYSTGLAPTYTYLPPRVGDRRGESSAVPLVPGNDTKGFGRFNTISEVALVFMATNKNPTNGTTTRMQAFLALEPFNPTSGAPGVTSNVRYRITGLDSLSVNGRSMAFPPVDTIRCSTAAGYLDSAGATAFSGFASQFKKANLSSAAADQFATATRQMARNNEDNNFPFYSGFVTTGTATEFNFDGGSFTIEVLSGFPKPEEAEVIQTLHVTFPPATLKVPRLVNEDFNNLTKRTQGDANNFVKTLIQDGDITRSVEIDVNGPTKGDLRILSAMRDVPASWYTPHPRYADKTVERLHFLRQGNQMVYGQFGPGDATDGPLGLSRNDLRAATVNTAGTLVKGIWYGRDSTPAVMRGQNGVYNSLGRPGDFDNGAGRVEDGPYINKADENNVVSNNQAADGDLGYFSRHGFGVENGLSFSPNRQITSAVAFGSLPSGIYGSQASPPDPHKPWQTLLFCPNPASRSTPAGMEPDEQDHEGFKGPRDHLWLDLFWMPVVEPYAISESFATAGKINMNTQMLPFRHIERNTGIHAVLKPVQLSAISPNSVGGTTPNGYNSAGGTNYKEGAVHRYELYYDVNRAETLKGFTKRFDTGDIFRSASEICEIFLVPQRRNGVVYNSDAAPPPTTYEDMMTWWNGGGLDTADAFEPTGDNSREAPYNQLYPRLTTRSNTFTVHFRVETLQKARSTAVDRWVEGKDLSTSSHRGSATLERYLDPQDPELAELTNSTPSHSQSWDRYYRFRIIERKTFAP